MNKSFDVWVTKYWSTRGIYKKEVHHNEHSTDPKSLKYVYTGGYQLMLGRDAFEVLGDAIAYCNAQRAKKLDSLKKSVKKYEKMLFTRDRLKG